LLPVLLLVEDGEDGWDGAIKLGNAAVVISSVTGCWGPGLFTVVREAWQGRARKTTGTTVLD
jgi:hypothetical protein